LEEVAVVQVDQADKTVKTEALQTKKEEEAVTPRDEKESAEEQENTHKWATAVLETKPKKEDETKGEEGKKAPEISKQEYDQMFHQAAE